MEIEKHSQHARKETCRGTGKTQKSFGVLKQVLMKLNAERKRVVRIMEKLECKVFVYKRRKLLKWL
ncbi:MAG: hypothetical protein NPIRA02_37430 [Nitrospirales bacterium]|nr:MAG: hypothetical protein NPIRA02_37430 [Nitrospirales bacterium]